MCIEVTGMHNDKSIRNPMEKAWVLPTLLLRYALKLETFYLLQFC